MLPQKTFFFLKKGGGGKGRKGGGGQLFPPDMAEMGNRAFVREDNHGLKYLRSSEMTENQFMKPQIVFHLVGFDLLFFLSFC